MRAPFVRRKTHEAELAAVRATVRERDQQLARLGHRVKATRQEHAKLLSDLRLVRVHIDYSRRHGDKIGFGFEVDRAVFDGFRHDRAFVNLISMMVERAMMETPEGRGVIAGSFA